MLCFAGAFWELGLGVGGEDISGIGDIIVEGFGATVATFKSIGNLCLTNKVRATGFLFLSLLSFLYSATTFKGWASVIGCWQMQDSQTDKNFLLCCKSLSLFLKVLRLMTCSFVHMKPSGSSIVFASLSRISLVRPRAASPTNTLSFVTSSSRNLASASAFPVPCILYGSRWSSLGSDSLETSLWGKVFQTKLQPETNKDVTSCKPCFTFFKTLSLLFRHFKCTLCMHGVCFVCGH